MASNGPSSYLQDDVYNEPGFFYTVLNLPRTATENEIKERHRSLSLIFHPDKQRDERTRETASRRFLEIQKAYEVLSDPFTRTVYDTLGYRGISRPWPKEWRLKPQNEVKQLLLFVDTDARQKDLSADPRPRGTLRIFLNGQPLLSRLERPRTWAAGLKQRADQFSILHFSLRETLQTRITDKLRVYASATASARDHLAFVGTARYQYSPNLALLTSTSFLRILHAPYLTSTVEYSDDELGSISAQASLHFPPRSLPPGSFKFRRQLFKDSPTQGAFGLTFGPKPSVSLEFITPSRVDLGYSGAGSDRGYAILTRRFGLTLAGVATSLRAGLNLSIPRLLAELRLELQLNPLSGPAGVLEGSWGDKDNSISSILSVSTAGVSTSVEVCYLGQRLALPFLLSTELDLSAAAYAAALPAATSILVYHFFIEPRERRKRLEFFQAARHEFEDEQSSARRDIANTASLLKDTARKHMQAEKAIGGLVILEANYGPTDSTPEARDLMADVTISLQALVHKSQLYIPGHRSKAGIPGFYDPAPGCPETLRVRYLFDDRMHYAEISDDRPCVLPLRDHVVDGPR